MNAVYGGQFEILKWLYNIYIVQFWAGNDKNNKDKEDDEDDEDDDPFGRSDVCNAAVITGRLDILRWLHEREFPWNSFTCCLAVRYICRCYIHTYKKCQSRNVCLASFTWMSI